MNTFNENDECIDIPAQLLMILEITTNTVTDSYYIAFRVRDFTECVSGPKH